MQYIEMVLNIIVNIFDWVATLDYYFYIIPLCMALFAFSTVTRFLIMPVLGGIGSDNAKNYRKSRSGKGGRTP